MTVYKVGVNETFVTVDLAKTILSGKTADANLVSSSGWAFDCSYNTSDYETSPGKKCPSFLLVPDVVTKDNMVDKLVTPGYYTQVGDYLKAR